MFDYKQYEALFNTGNDAALVERFFDDEVVFSGGSREMRGKPALSAFLAWAHDGVREVMRPQNVLQQGNLLFAEIDMDFHASKERPEFPFGHLYAGDLVTVKFFVTYRLHNDKVVELKSMTWSPGKGVTQLPRLGPHPSQLAALHSYIAAFGGGQFDRMVAFYTPDVLLQLGSVPPLVGREAIAGFYRSMYERVREHLTVNDIKATDEAIELDAVTRFTAIEDAPDFIVGALKKGEFIEGRVLVSYQLVKGLIGRISVRRLGDMRHSSRGAL
jgi:ketosteroid isomerase-like protein